MERVTRDRDGDGISSALKPWQSILLIAAASTAIIYAIHVVRQHAAISNSEMVALLPRGEDNTVFLADLALLRQAGVLGWLAGSKATSEPEYQTFVQQTGFDYSKDIDALSASFDGKQLFFVLRGRFNWKRLQSYAIAQGGACRGSFCNAPTSRPARWVSLLLIAPDVMGLAVGSDGSAAYALSPRREPEPIQIPPDPAWLSVPRSVLANPATLPAALQLFAAPLAQAERVLLSVGGSTSAWVIRLDAQCDSVARARIVRDRLEDRTSLIKRAVTRERGAANAGDLTGLVAGGSFQQIDKRVVGSWPLKKELLQALQ